ncbi:MAG: glycosyltransferase family 39 protein, partial [Flavobacteriales bacterium]
MAKTEKVILAVILFIGAALRIYNYWDFSLSNDELSALARLNFNSFSELLHKGIKIDGHPPAAQVILYYTTKVFGNSVAVVRFPFVLAGILAIYYMYQLAKEWISSSAGLLSAALFASLSFPILYSRIARPYALGMLFVLMAATYWIRILKEKGTTKDFILLAISLTLC